MIGGASDSQGRRHCRRPAAWTAPDPQKLPSMSCRSRSPVSRYAGLGCTPGLEAAGRRRRSVARAANTGFCTFFGLDAATLRSGGWDRLFAEATRALRCARCSSAATSSYWWRVDRCRRPRRLVNVRGRWIAADRASYVACCTTSPTRRGALRRPCSGWVCFACSPTTPGSDRVLPRQRPAVSVREQGRMPSGSASTSSRSSARRSPRDHRAGTIPAESEPEFARVTEEGRPAIYGAA
jgi:hypothetical protein